MAIVGVVVAHLALGIFLMRGLAIGLLPAALPAYEPVDLTFPPPPPLPTVREVKKATTRAAARPAVLAPEGGPKGPANIKTVAPDVTRSSLSTAPAPGGGAGSGTAVGTGGGNSNGDGDGEGGSDSEKIAGEITDRDYPAELGRTGVSGTVSLTLVVNPSGRVERCTIERSSGSPELDQLTCRLIQARFRFRPATDRAGRAIADEIEWDHSWTSRIR